MISAILPANQCADGPEYYSNRTAPESDIIQPELPTRYGPTHPG